MPFGEKSLKLSAIFLFFLLFFIAFASLSAQDLDILVSINDTTGYPGEISYLTVKLANYNDSLSGFGFRFSLDRDDLIYFRREFDSAGTIISGWEIIISRLTNGDSLDYQLIGIANSQIPEPIVRPYPPHQNLLPLVRVPVYLNDIPDTAVNRRVNVDIEVDLDHVEFVNEDYRIIGLLTDTLVDTLWFDCESREGDSCLIWVETEGPPADSMYIDSIFNGRLDTTKIMVIDGSITVLTPVCGDLTGNYDVDIADITRLISFLYLEGAPPVCMRAANVNGSPDDEVDIADITRLIQFLYLDGDDLDCPIQ